MASLAAAARGASGARGPLRAAPVRAGHGARGRSPRDRDRPPRCARRRDRSRAAARGAGSPRPSTATASTTSSSGSSSSGWSRGWGASGRPSSSSTRPRWPRSRGSSPGTRRVAERFELYAHGLELANGFSELTDAAEQRAPAGGGAAPSEVAPGRPVYPLDEAFLEAVGRMPPSGGVAVGLDRVLMLLLGAERIEDVLLFPAHGFVDPRASSTPWRPTRRWAAAPWWGRWSSRLVARQARARGPVIRGWWRRRARRGGGARGRAPGLEHLPAGTCVLVCNHQSNFDAPLRLRAAAEAHPVRGQAGAVPDPVFGAALKRWATSGRPRRGARATAERTRGGHRAGARPGCSIIFFAEGTRSTDGRLRPFKKGAAILAIHAQVPMVPVAVAGATRSPPRASLWVHSGRPLVLRVGKPIPTTGLAGEDRDTLTLQAHDAVAALLEGGTGGARGDADHMSAGKDMNTLERLLAMHFAAHPWHGVALGDRAPERGDASTWRSSPPTPSSTSWTRIRAPPHRPARSCSPAVADPLRLHSADLLRARTSVSAAPSAPGASNIEGDQTRWTSACSASSASPRQRAGAGAAHRRAADDRRQRGRRQDHRGAAADSAYGDLEDVAQLPPGVLDRLQHYFLTYKQMPGERSARWRSPRSTTAPRPRRCPPEPGRLRERVRAPLGAGQGPAVAARSRQSREVTISSPAQYGAPTARRRR